MENNIIDSIDGVYISIAMNDLPISNEAKIFYFTRCMNQRESINQQHREGIEIPKIKMSGMDIFKYRRTYDLSEEEMNSIIEELKEVDAIEITD